MTREEQIERRLAQLRKMGSEYAKAKAQVDYIEEFKKSKLAILMKHAERMGFTTAAAQEREARASNEYIELLDGYRVAVERAVGLRWELTCAELGAEVWRSLESTRRTEMSLYGGDGPATILGGD